MDQWFLLELESTVISNMQIPPWTLYCPQWRGRRPKQSFAFIWRRPRWVHPKWGLQALNWRKVEGSKVNLCPAEVGAGGLEVLLRTLLAIVPALSPGQQRRIWIKCTVNWGKGVETVRINFWVESVCLCPKGRSWLGWEEWALEEKSGSLALLYLPCVWSQSPLLAGACEERGLDQVRLRAPSVHLFIHYKHFLYLLCAKH